MVNETVAIYMQSPTEGQFPPIGAAILKLAPGERLLVFAPADWSPEMCFVYQGWMEKLYPTVPWVFLPASSQTAVVSAMGAENLRLLHPDPFEVSAEVAH